jgi:hypothetical protein
MVLLTSIFNITSVRFATDTTTIPDLDTTLDNRVEEPAVWPVILWVAFQVKARYSLQKLRSTDIGALLAIIESQSPADKYTGLWQWDDSDEKMLRKTFVSQDGRISSWIERYPHTWREYIHLLDSRDWAHLNALTGRTSRPRLIPTEYDAAIRVGAIVLWTSSNSIPFQQTNTTLTLDTFVADILGPTNNYVSQALPQVSPILAAFHVPVINLA